MQQSENVGDSAGLIISSGSTIHLTDRPRRGKLQQPQSTQPFLFFSTNHFPRWCRAIQEVGSEGQPMKKLFYQWPMTTSSCLTPMCQSVAVSEPLWPEGVGWVNWCPATTPNSHPPIHTKTETLTIIELDANTRGVSACFSGQVCI